MAPARATRRALGDSPGGDPRRSHTLSLANAFAQVKVDRLAVTYGATRALSGVSVTFDRGTVTTLEGPNGAGKSTLLSVLATLIKPAAGRVLYDNLELPDDRARVRPAIGLVAHDALVYPDLTGRESLELFARLYRVARVPDAIAQVCEQYGLNSFIDRPARTLSRGQLQRLALARATVHRPSLLLFDEPTTGLDQASTERVANAIEASRALGRIVVVVTHDQALAARVATRRAHFVRGRLERIDPVRDA